jgi:hypothetical protein
MSTSARSRAARDSLRRLLTPHALDFGARLLRSGNGGTIRFREFVAVARELVRERPEQSALYLATLVALDMHGEEDGPRPMAPAPSPN